MPLALTRASRGPVTAPCVAMMVTSIRVGSPSTYVGCIAISTRPFGSSVGTTMIVGVTVRSTETGRGPHAATASAIASALTGRHTAPRDRAPGPHQAEQRRGNEHDGATGGGIDVIAEPDARDG